MGLFLTLSNYKQGDTMSGKSAKTTKKSTEPRQLAEIQQQYQEGCLRAGQLQYQVSVLTQDLATLNEDLLSINKEAALRQQLDKAAQQTETASV